MNPAPLTRLRVSARACPSPPSEFSTDFSGTLADHSPDVLAVAFCAAPTLANTVSLAEHGPGLVGGTITLVDASFTTKTTVHSGTTAFKAFGCVELLNTGSLQTFIRRDVLEKMLSGGAATIICEQDSAPRSWGRFGKSAPKRICSCSLMPFGLSAPEGSAPVISRPHRINPTLAKEVDATLNPCLVACLIQHSTSPCSSPMVVVSKKPGGVRIAVNYKKLNDISRLANCPSRGWIRSWTL